jgi:hypothetical protein
MTENPTAMEEQLKDDIARLIRIVGVQTVTIREILDALQSVKVTMDRLTSCLEKIMEKQNASSKYSH